MSIFRKKVREFVPNTAGSDRESGFHYMSRGFITGLRLRGLFNRSFMTHSGRTFLLSTLASAR